MSLHNFYGSIMKQLFYLPEKKFNEQTFNEYYAELEQFIYTNKPVKYHVVLPLENFNCTLDSPVIKLSDDIKIVPKQDSMKIPEKEKLYIKDEDGGYFYNPTIDSVKVRLLSFDVPLLLIIPIHRGDFRMYFLAGGEIGVRVLGWGERQKTHLSHHVVTASLPSQSSFLSLKFD